MTFSIVARSADGKSHGVAVASKYLCVGAVCPAAEPDVGAVATQSYPNLSYRPQALMMLRTGVAADDVVAGLTAADPLRDKRQLGVVGVTGDGATFTGAGCFDWAGGVTGDGYAVQGNILTGPKVVEAMQAAWLASDPAAPLARRLLAALQAGDAAGGDRRGKQSAALLVVAKGKGLGGISDTVADLRSDDHPEPCLELERLLDIHTLLFDEPDPATLLPLAGALVDEVAELVAAQGYDSLEDWAGVQNLEARLTIGKIDPLVLEHLRNTRRSPAG